jgi:hypothetical protein
MRRRDFHFMLFAQKKSRRKSYIYRLYIVVVVTINHCYSTVILPTYRNFFHVGGKETWSDAKSTAFHEIKL